MTDLPARYLERIERLSAGQRKVLSMRLGAAVENVQSIGQGAEKAQRLVAYALSESQTEADPEALRQFLRRRLPEFMQPSEIILLNDFPRTPNGKVDLRALPTTSLADQAEPGGLMAPRTELERQLVEIWEDLLGTRPIGIRDDFFELGGHSLLSMRFFVQLETKLGIKLPLTMLFEEATIEYLAEKIVEENRAVDWPTLVPIQPEGHRPPFFCIHGQTGDVLWFRELGDELAPDQPLYGLQARGLDGEQEPLLSIEEMATHYIEVIRSLQPEGPYFLGGASLGGTIAFEMAQRLRAANEGIALLAMFDHAAYNLEYKHQGPAPIVWLRILLRFMTNFPRWLSTFLRLSPGQIFGRGRRKLRLALKLVSSGATGPDIAPQRVSARDMLDYADELPQYRRKLIEVNYDAITNYRPSSYAGRITLFQAESQPLFSLRDPDVGWKTLAEGRVDVHRLPGSHEEIFRQPNVRRLAELLRACIDAALEGPHP